jgi:BirA family biotin operon repressor/biotin-[acetyl-CoA-carboxylase] ligase
MIPALFISHIAMERINYILEMLYCNSGGWLSGEEISRKLGISRTAVWKYINILREAGYIIESSSRHGHKLISRSNTFTDFEISRNLNTKIFGRKEIHIFPETDSSNTQAFRIASGGASEGSIVIAESQTGGKGRLGRKWVSPSGKNLYLSLIIRPLIPIQFAPRITLVTAMALSDTLTSIGAEKHRIKWPNDILFDEKKISGILTEMKGDCDSIDFIIIGLGINLNSSSADYPEELKDTAVSLKEITGNEVDRVGFLSSFLFHFEKNYTDFLQGRFPDILERWLWISAIINQKIKVTNHDGVFTGTVTAVTPDGNLIVQTKDGTSQVSSGDINYLKGMDD